jgi:hypothetical protein
MDRRRTLLQHEDAPTIVLAQWLIVTGLMRAGPSVAPPCFDNSARR